MNKKVLLRNIMINKVADFEKIDVINHSDLIPLYKDRYMSMSVDKTFEKVYISSLWWGKIKDSHFTVSGFFGRTDTVIHGVFNISELKEWHKVHIRRNDPFKYNQINLID